MEVPHLRLAKPLRSLCDLGAEVRNKHEGQTLSVRSFEKMFLNISSTFPLKLRHTIQFLITQATGNGTEEPCQEHEGSSHRATFHPRHRQPVNHHGAKQKLPSSGQVRRLNTNVSASGDLKSIGSIQISVKRRRQLLFSKIATRVHGREEPEAGAARTMLS